jgi:hypothetical protein
MTKLLAVCCIAMFAGFAAPTSAQEKQQPLRLTQTIPLPGVKGRLDHMGVDLEKKRHLWPLLPTIRWKSWI